MAGAPIRVNPRVLAGALGAVLAVCSFVKPWESPPTGPVLEPYQDIVGVWTWCDGITTGPRKEHYTRAECDALLRNQVAVRMRALAQCIHRPLERNQWVALGSLGYNTGIPALCRSTLVALINAGQPAAVWCRQILRWDYAGGRRVRGLTLRRRDEYRLCVGAE